MALLLATVLCWVTLLRRQVTRQTSELQRANETLMRLSWQDGLTGLANRRRFR